MKTVSVILLIFALILETSITTIPLVMLVLLMLTVLFKDKFIFIFAFIFGILLDLLSIRAIGLSSIFFGIYIYLILLYQSKFEITTNNFIIVASFLGSFIYLFINGLTSNLILESFTSTILGIIIFILIKRYLMNFK